MSRLQEACSPRRCAQEVHEFDLAVFFRTGDCFDRWTRPRSRSSVIELLRLEPIQPRFLPIAADDEVAPEDEPFHVDECKAVAALEPQQRFADELLAQLGP